MISLLDEWTPPPHNHDDHQRIVFGCPRCIRERLLAERDARQREEYRGYSDEDLEYLAAVQSDDIADDELIRRQSLADEKIDTIPLFGAP